MQKSHQELAVQRAKDKTIAIYLSEGSRLVSFFLLMLAFCMLLSLIHVVISPNKRNKTEQKSCGKRREWRLLAPTTNNVCPETLNLFLETIICVVERSLPAKIDWGGYSHNMVSSFLLCPATIFRRANLFSPITHPWLAAYVKMFIGIWIYVSL